MSLSQAELLARAGRGDVHAFARLVEIYRAPLISFVLGILPRREEAEEIAQEAFCRLWEYLPRLRRPERMIHWLYQTARNLAISTLRKPRAVALPDDAAQCTPDVPKDDHAVEVHRAVGELPEPFRVVVFLRHFSGMSHEQIARFLAIPEGTVRSRLSRAYAQLRTRLADRLEE